MKLVHLKLWDLTVRINQLKLATLFPFMKYTLLS